MGIPLYLYKSRAHLETLILLLPSDPTATPAQPETASTQAPWMPPRAVAPPDIHLVDSVCPRSPSLPRSRSGFEAHWFLGPNQQTVHRVVFPELYHQTLHRVVFPGLYHQTANRVVFPGSTTKPSGFQGSTTKPIADGCTSVHPIHRHVSPGPRPEQHRAPRVFARRCPRLSATAVDPPASGPSAQVRVRPSPWSFGTALLRVRPSPPWSVGTALL